MAKVILNSVFQSMQGTLGDCVVRRCAAGHYVSRRPTVVAPPSARQILMREQFCSAVAYARDAAARLPYDHVARKKRLSLHALAVADFLKGPVVRGIDLSGFHGIAGDVIKVRAYDNFEVTGVMVAIRTDAGELIQQGSAVSTGGVWQFAASVAIAAAQALTIEAIAKDRPGHAGSLSINHVVGVKI